MGALGTRHWAPSAPRLGNFSGDLCYVNKNKNTTHPTMRRRTDTRKSSGPMILRVKRPSPLN